MDRHRLIFLGCAFVLILANGFVWYKTIYQSEEVTDVPIEQEVTTSQGNLFIDERTPYELVNIGAEVLQESALKTSIYGGKFIWPYPTSFQKVIREDTGQVSEGFDLKDAAGNKVASGTCGSFGHYEGPYDAEYLGVERRSFERNGESFTIKYSEFEKYRYSSSGELLPLTGTPNEIIIEVESAIASEARKKEGVVWRTDICLVIGYEDDNAGMSDEVRSDLKTLYNSWQ